MPNKELLTETVNRLNERNWDEAAIRANFERLRTEGIPARDLSGLADKRDEVLDRVQRRAEEYEYLSHSCSKSSALAVMEEFGLGNMDVIRAMSPFPGFAMTGEICGAVTGSLIALGLFFGDDDLENYEATGRTMAAAREFIPKFKEELGTINCPEIQEEVIFGRYMDPRGSAEKFQAFIEARGYHKCALPPGVGARLAAGIILDSLAEQG